MYQERFWFSMVVLVYHRVVSMLNKIIASRIPTKPGCLETSSQSAILSVTEPFQKKTTMKTHGKPIHSYHCFFPSSKLFQKSAVKFQAGLSELTACILFSGQYPLIFDTYWLPPLQLGFLSTVFVVFFVFKNKGGVLRGCNFPWEYPDWNFKFIWVYMGR